MVSLPLCSLICRRKCALFKTAHFRPFLHRFRKKPKKHRCPAATCSRTRLRSGGFTVSNLRPLRELDPGRTLAATGCSLRWLIHSKVPTCFRTGPLNSYLMLRASSLALLICRRQFALFKTTHFCNISASFSKKTEKILLPRSHLQLQPTPIVQFH